ncbi:MAG: hypothetical protein IT379_34725 [Deltaproteobacteria bacterium]|nr:hypothetical protein [Deltaproteobacteria bacterium]
MTTARQWHAGAWLFSPGIDLLCFLGSAVLSFALLGVGIGTGQARGATPDVLWLATVLAIDVAHVWGSLYRVYFDGDEVRRRPGLYVGAPIFLYLAGIALHAAGARVFWGVLAYLAVFHFVRQQYGWVAWYRTRAGEQGRLDRVLDTTIVYAATVFPILWWHGALPRRFFWLMPGDFLASGGVVAACGTLAAWLHPVHWALLALFVGRQLWLLATRQPVNAGKVVVVLTTWALWYVGIVVCDGDYAFTVTNVVAHGIPYLALTWRYARGRADEGSSTVAARLARGGLAVVAGSLVAFAFVEEMAWDRLVWHERDWLFPLPEVALGAWATTLVVPLLALPQATHYLLDAWVWRRGPSNPTLRVLGRAAPPR